MSIGSASKLDKDAFLAKLIRDLIQTLYLTMAIIGISGFTTKISLIKNKLTYDRASFSYVAVCCFITALSFPPDYFKEKVCPWIDLTATFVASLYIGIAFVAWKNRREKQS